MLKNSFIFTSAFVFLSINLQAQNTGSLLFHGNCITCHNEIKNLSAPSIMNIKENYLRAFSQEKDFVNYMTEWVSKPNKEGSLMLGAIKKYELMPHLNYEKSTLKIIVKYIYNTDFSKQHEGHKEKSN